MTTKKPTSASSQRAPSNGAAAPQDMLADAGRQQMAVAADAAAVLFRGSEEIRGIQQQAANHARERHELAARKLHGNCSPADVLSVQAELVTFDMQGAAAYWQQVASVLMRTQVDMLACTTHLMDGQAGNGFKPALDAWQATLDNAAGAANTFLQPH